MKLPNLIIAGAGKCGTTTLYKWLVAHPDVSGSDPKEPQYFIDPDQPFYNPKANYRQHGLSGYKRFFAKCSPSTKIWLEASPQYMCQKSALDFFSACKPQPHIVFLLRKPSKMVFSDFNFNQNNLASFSKKISFQQYVDLLLSNQLLSIEKKFYCERQFRILSDKLSHGQYYDWLSQWKDKFEPDLLNIILFENMISNPKNTMQRLAIDIGIDPSFYEDFNFSIENQTVAIRNTWIHRKIHYFTPRIAGFPFIHNLRNLYFSIQEGKKEKLVPDPEALQQLDDYFSPYNHELASLFDLNLECWS